MKAADPRAEKYLACSVYIAGRYFLGPALTNKYVNDRLNTADLLSGLGEDGCISVPGAIFCSQLTKNIRPDISLPESRSRELCQQV